MCAYLNAESEVCSKLIEVMLQQVHHPLVEGVVFSLHVRVVHRLAQDVLVERPREVTVQELVVVDRFGDDPAYKLEVVQVNGVNVGTRIGHVRGPVPSSGLEQSIVGVKHLPGNNQVPLPQ